MFEIEKVLERDIDLYVINKFINDPEFKNLFLKKISLSNFELDRQLYDGIKEFNKYKAEFPNLKNDETFMKIDISLNESEAEITAMQRDQAFGMKSASYCRST